MKVTFSNTLHLTKDSIGIPFMIENSFPIGMVTDINNDTYTVEIWDRCVGMELKDDEPFGVYLSTKEQYTYDEFMKIVR